MDNSKQKLYQFLNPPLSPDNVAHFYVRHSILRGLKDHLTHFKGTVLDIGCGEMPYKSLICDVPQVQTYIGLDFVTGHYAQRLLPNLTWDGQKIPLQSHSVDVALATEVLEHVPEPLPLLTEIKRVLKPDGFFLLTVPFLWPLHDIPYDEYRYTPFAMERLLKQVGFEYVSVKALGGWHASMAQLIGLWLKRAPMPPFQRQLLNILLFPVYKKLIQVDKAPTSFRKSQMITGLLAVARMQPPVIVHHTAPKQSNTRLCIVHNKNALTETFIQAHIEHLPVQKLVLYRNKFQLPAYQADGALLPLPWMPEQLQQTSLGRAVVTRALNRERWAQAALKHFLHRHNIEAVLAEYGVNGVKMMASCRDLNLPLIVHFHGVDAYGRDFLQGVGRAYPAMFEQAAAIIAVSRDMEQQLLKLGAPSHKLHYNPYGIDANRFQGANPANAPPLFVSVGRFVDKKAPQLTLVAFHKVLTKMPEAQLMMLGDGPLEESTRQLAFALKLSNSVQFMGACSHVEVANAMVKARAFVQHSVQTSYGDSEGTPLSILEASATALPVIATRHAGIKDVIIDGETGYLVDEYDVDTMAEKMLHLATDNYLAATLGQAARQRVKANFSLETQIQNLWQIIETAIRTHKSGV